MSKHIVVSAAIIAAASVGIAAYAISNPVGETTVQAEASTEAAVTSATEVTYASEETVVTAAKPIAEAAVDEEKTAVTPQTDVHVPIDGYEGVDFGGAANLEEYGFSGWYRLPAEAGTEVYSVLDGTVEYAGYWHGFGNTVSIAHTDGTYSIYSHLGVSEIFVSVGDAVECGQTIGAVGSTGETFITGLAYARSEISVYNDYSELPTELIAYDPYDFYANPCPEATKGGIITDAEGNVISYM